ncbi:hypothetical protein HQ945_05530 [Phyllobacterium sp. BT25]|uniref:Uncharacterized protein n=1 Tax=Phyllobacterium pellucidum TaxID=2740464 RepID=A0A849VLF2_9HYPH|nr:hypothetical protein [Phyllobacterium pellucidum]NTS30708.1 hypothetical protein [Phyllobacterium pellucidum]
MTSVPLHAPYEVRRSRKIAAAYDRTHLQLKLEVARKEAALAQMEFELGLIVEHAMRRSQETIL